LKNQNDITQYYSNSIIPNEVIQYSLFRVFWFWLLRLSDNGIFNSCGSCAPKITNQNVYRLHTEASAREPNEANWVFCDSGCGPPFDGKPFLSRKPWSLCGVCTQSALCAQLARVCVRTRICPLVTELQRSHRLQHTCPAGYQRREQEQCRKQERGTAGVMGAEVEPGHFAR